MVAGGGDRLRLVEPRSELKDEDTLRASKPRLSHATSRTRLDAPHRQSLLLFADPPPRRLACFLSSPTSFLTESTTLLAVSAAFLAAVQSLTV